MNPLRSRLEREWWIDSSNMYRAVGGQSRRFTVLILVLLGLSLAAGGPMLHEHRVIEGAGRGQADPWRLSADKCSWLHVVLVRTRHAEQVDLLWHLCGLLAAADRPTGRRARRDRQARNDRTDGWIDPSHLRRPSALHLHRRLCSRPVHGQQHQLEWWVLVRDICVWLTPWDAVYLVARERVAPNIALPNGVQHSW